MLFTGLTESENEFSILLGGFLATLAYMFNEEDYKLNLNFFIWNLFLPGLMLL